MRLRPFPKKCSPASLTFASKKLLRNAVSDVEWSYTVLALMESAITEKPVSVLFKHGGLVPKYQR